MIFIEECPLGELAPKGLSQTVRINLPYSFFAEWVKIFNGFLKEEIFMKNFFYMIGIYLCIVDDGL